LGQDRPPAVDATDWPRSPIDSFILEKLEANQLRPAQDADRRTLLRRTYFQLVGLPPTREQVAAFLEDMRPDVYERLVDQLLSSPQFGETWGRHWLDLARYADSNGLDENFLFREAWRYRNWVIAAVNADLSFDRFLTEQLAGDLLPFDSVEQRDWQRIAAGFLVVGPKVLLGNDPRERRMDIADRSTPWVAPFSGRRWVALAATIISSIRFPPPTTTRSPAFLRPRRSCSAATCSTSSGKWNTSSGSARTATR
jgi:hypothetical protein